jgi:glutamine amidotransferase
MGWSEVEKQNVNHPLVQQMENDARYYFTHSYYMDPVNPEDVLLQAKYGIKFAAAVNYKNIVGVQFHPEKSHRFGKQLLEAFTKWSL